MSHVPLKLKGIKRLLHAASYSWDGICAAYKSEAAFRQEIWLACVLIPVSIFISASIIEHVLLVASVIFMLVCELINTAIETIVERISMEWNILSKKAKDIGSAIVFLSCAQLIMTWVLIIAF